MKIYIKNKPVIVKTANCIYINDLSKSSKIFLTLGNQVYII